MLEARSVSLGRSGGDGDAPEIDGNGVDVNKRQVLKKGQVLCAALYVRIDTRYMHHFQ